MNKLKLVQLFSIAVPATSRNLYGNMTAVGRRWVAGSFISLIGFNTTKMTFISVLFQNSLRRKAYRRVVASE